MHARDSADLTRRRFTKTAAALAVSPLFSMAACRGRQAPEPPPNGGGGGPSRKSSGGSDPELDALTELVRKRHGARLDAEQLEAVRASIRSNVRAAHQLRDHPLPMNTGPALGVPVPPRT